MDRWILLLAASMLASTAGARQKEAEPTAGTTQWTFAVSRAGKAAGRLEVGIARRDGETFAVSACYPGVSVAKALPKKAKPAVRSYAELGQGGTLGKYKRWEPRGKGEQYWFVFPFEGKVKLRYEKGPGDKGKVKVLGEGDRVVPLDREQPQLAWLLAGPGKPAETACAGANPAVFGKAQVRRSGSEEVDLYGGGKATLDRWVATGDCGDFSVYLDASGDPVVMLSGQTRYDRVAAKE